MAAWCCDIMKHLEKKKEGRKKEKRDGMEIAQSETRLKQGLKLINFLELMSFRPSQTWPLYMYHAYMVYGSVDQTDKSSIPEDVIAWCNSFQFDDQITKHSIVSVCMCRTGLERYLSAEWDIP